VNPEGLEALEWLAEFERELSPQKVSVVLNFDQPFPLLCLQLLDSKDRDIWDDDYFRSCMTASTAIGIEALNIVVYNRLNYVNPKHLKPVLKMTGRWSAACLHNIISMEYRLTSELIQQCDGLKSFEDWDRYRLNLPNYREPQESKTPVENDL
jgi:hypothetical protein